MYYSYEFMYIINKKLTVICLFEDDFYTWKFSYINYKFQLLINIQIILHVLDN